MNATTRAEALERMTRALEASKKARDGGRNVSEFRKRLKIGRRAFEAGRYEEACRLADEILNMLSAQAREPGGHGGSGERVIREREVVIREIVKIPCRYCGSLTDVTAGECSRCNAPIR